MKTLIIIVLSLTFVLSIYFLSNNLNAYVNLTVYKEPIYSKIVDKLINSSSKKIAQKHNLKLFGVSEKMMGCVRGIGFDFQMNGNISKNEGRELVINCVQEFLIDINENEEIRSYLEVYPFDAKHVDITIYIYSPKNEKLYHPDLAVISAFNGIIDYSTNDPEGKTAYKIIEEEKYEDAVKMLKGEMEIPPSQIK